MRRTIVVSWILFFSHLMCFSQPTRQDERDLQKSCRDFVQSFYDWYVKHPDSSRALRERPSAFNPELARALKEDDEAQAKSPGEIVGLDSDPILSGNDRPPGEHYVVSHVSLKGEATCWVELRQFWSGRETNSKASETGDIVAAKLVNNGGVWHFVNFYYGDPQSPLAASVSRGGLLSILKSLREVREKASKAGPAAQQQDRVLPEKPTPAIKTPPRN